MTLAIVVTGAASLYALACWALPFGRCVRCSGSGTRTTTIRSRPRPCRLCKGSGLRLRLGRRGYNFATRLHRDATARRTAGS